MNAYLMRAKPEDTNQIGYFLEQGIVAIGWSDLDDLSNASRSDIENILKSERDYGSRQLGQHTGVIDGFVNDLDVGDLLVVPDGGDIYFAAVATDYYYCEDAEKLPHRRRVRWFRDKQPLSRSELPEKLQSSLRVPLTFCFAPTDTVRQLLPEISFNLGTTYTKQDIYDFLNVPPSRQDGDWDTGYHRHDDSWFIFCNIGSTGRTGHDYENRFEADDLVWFGQQGATAEHESIQSMLSDETDVFVFFRQNDRDDWTYAGRAKPKSVDDGVVPVKVVWGFDDTREFRPERNAQETTEGATVERTVNAYERNPALRQACLDHHGTACAVCGMSFAERYGDIGDGFIHVHHLTPLSSIEGEIEVDPVEDLRPVCPNCHNMLHTKSPPWEIEELREQLQ